MDLKIAIENIEAVAAVYKGTLEEHTGLQFSIKTIKEALGDKLSQKETPKEPKAPKKNKK